MKTLRDISWQVPEEEYRQDKALSYSTLAKFAREGYNGLSKLFDRVDTPSLTFGSAVDSIITGGQQEFDERFFVAEFPEVPDSIQPIVGELFSLYGETYMDLYEIPDKIIIDSASRRNYQNNWKPETKAKVIREKANEYYKLLYVSGDKTILTTEVYNEVLATVRALKESDSTRWYFADNNPFDDVTRYYQLKFKATLNGIDYRCMADLLIVVPSKKLIIPVDLKTSSKPEWDFFKSFIEWRYDIQARLYWRIIRDNLDRHPEFQDYTLAPYEFIAVNKKTFTPLVWEFSNTEEKGRIELNTKSNLVFEDPESIGQELTKYLKRDCGVPHGIRKTELNNIEAWIESSL